MHCSMRILASFRQCSLYTAPYFFLKFVLRTHFRCGGICFVTNFPENDATEIIFKIGQYLPVKVI